MPDYLKPVGKLVTRLSVIGCAVAGMIFLLLFAVLLASMLSRGSFTYEGKPLWMSLPITAGLGAAALWIAWRLHTNAVAPNSITVMPVWFVRVFGVLFLAGMVLAALASGRKYLLIEGIPVALAMIFLDRLIARRRKHS